MINHLTESTISSLSSWWLRRLIIKQQLWHEEKKRIHLVWHDVQYKIDVDLHWKIFFHCQQIWHFPNLPVLWLTPPDQPFEQDETNAWELFASTYMNQVWSAWGWQSAWPVWDESHPDIIRTIFSMWPCWRCLTCRSVDFLERQA